MEDEVSFKKLNDSTPIFKDIFFRFLNKYGTLTLLNIVI